MGCPQDFHRIFIGNLWGFHWISIGMLWRFQKISIGFLQECCYGISIGFPQDFHRKPTGFTQDFHRNMLYGFHWPQRIHSDILSAFHSHKFSDFDVSLLHSCCVLLIAYLMTFANNTKSIHYMQVLRGLNTIECCMVFIGPNEFIVIF